MKGEIRHLVKTTWTVLGLARVYLSARLGEGGGRYSISIWYAWERVANMAANMVGKGYGNMEVVQLGILGEDWDGASKALQPAAP